MSLRDVLISLAAGALAAVLTLAVLTLSVGAVLASQLAQLPLFLIGLSLGVKASLIAAAGGIAVATAATNLTAGLLYGGFIALPVTVLVRQALRARGDGQGGIEWYPPAGLLLWAIGLALLVAATTLPGAMGPDGAELARGAEVAQEILRRMGGGAVPQAEAEAMAAAALRYMPGFLGLWFVATLVVNFALAQGLLARIGRALRPSPRLTELALPLWVSAGAAIAVIGAVGGGAAGTLGGNLAIVLAFAFLLAGLAGLHAALAGSPLRRPALVAIYLSLILFAPALIAVVLLGLLEPWLGLRERFAGPAPKL
jgi:hypothetical protein